MLVDHRGQPLTARKQPRTVRARYDSAGPDEDNARHWAMADSLSAVKANSESVRRKLRERSRYEVANNSYARGSIDTIASYTIGRGPTLQLTYRGDSANDDPDIRKAGQTVEWLFSNWAYAKRLTQSLRTACTALDQDGESFALLVNSERQSVHTPVTLDVRLYEADQFSDPSGGWELDDSGVRLGPDGQPSEYSILRVHPGDDVMFTGQQADWLPASQVIHCFRRERPGQLRGIPRTTPALPLFAQLRRYILATITAAETAADFAAVLYSDSPGDDDEQMEPWDRLPIERGALLSVPGGSRLAQLKAEHPTATFDEFVKAILREIARCLSLPACLMLGDSSSYNFSSARMDLNSFTRQMQVDRTTIFERDFLDRVYEAWLAEALLINGFLPEMFADEVEGWEWSWRWESPPQIDRQKNAEGAETELRNNMTTLAREWSSIGADWETEVRQLAREKALLRELGLSVDEATPQASQDKQVGGFSTNDE